MVETRFILRVLFVPLCLLSCAKSGPNERRLLHHLLDRYNILERPVEYPGKRLEVKFGLALDGIGGLSIGFNKFTIHVKNFLQWEDCNLRWNSSEFGEISDLKALPIHRIWGPDIKIREEANGNHDVKSISYTPAEVTNAGKVTYVSTGAISTPKCRIDTRNYPFDEHDCDFVFSSWNYDEDELDLVLFEKNATSLADFQQNEYWKLIGFTAKREVTPYTYLPSGSKPSKPFLIFTIKVRRNGEAIYALIVFLASLSGWLLLFSRFLPIRGGRVWLVTGIFIPILFALQIFNPQYSGTDYENLSHTDNVFIIMAKLTLFVLICDILMNRALMLGEDSAEIYYGALKSKILPIQERLDKLLWFVPSGVTQDKMENTVPNNSMDSSTQSSILRPVDKKNSNVLLVSIMDRVLFILTVLMVAIVLTFCLPDVPT